MTISNNPQTLGFLPLDNTHTLACPSIPVSKIWQTLPSKYLTALENNEEIAECCRNPKEHAHIEAWYSCDKERDKGVPDIYKFFCTSCERTHVRFCIGGDHGDAPNHNKFDRPDLFDHRPFWEVR